MVSIESLLHRGRIRNKAPPYNLYISLKKVTCKNCSGGCPPAKTEAKINMLIKISNSNIIEATEVQASTAYFPSWQGRNAVFFEITHPISPLTMKDLIDTGHTVDDMFSMEREYYFYGPEWSAEEAYEDACRRISELAENNKALSVEDLLSPYDLELD